MSNICIITDSRGAFKGPNYNWVDFYTNNSNNYHFISLEKSRSFSSLFIHVPIVLNEQTEFDLAIIQIGISEYILPWKKPVWKELLEKIDPSYPDHLTRFPDTTIGLHLFNNCYHYRNDDIIKEFFSKLRQRCKKLLFIELPYTWKPWIEKTKIMNELFSSCCDATIPLSQDPTFPAKCTANTNWDRVHYLDDFAKQLSDMIIEKSNILLSNK